MVDVGSTSMNYTAYTKAGNPYNRTKNGRRLGTIAGLGVGTYAAVKVAKDGSFLKTLKKMVSFKTAKKLGKWGVIGLAVGAVVDAITNKVRKNKADKAASVKD